MLEVPYMSGRSQYTGTHTLRHSLTFHLYFQPTGHCQHMPMYKNLSSVFQSIVTFESTYTLEILGIFCPMLATSMFIRNKLAYIVLSSEGPYTLEISCHMLYYVGKHPTH